MGRGACLTPLYIPPQCPMIRRLRFSARKKGTVMESVITGKAYVLGDNIDTDQIIPAQYLSFNPADPEERKFFGMYACAGVPDVQGGLPKGYTPLVQPNQFKTDYRIVIGG